MCSKFHLDDMKTVGGVWDTIFHQQTNQPSVDYNISPTRNIISWGIKHIRLKQQ